MNPFSDKPDWFYPQDLTKTRLKQVYEKALMLASGMTAKEVLPSLFPTVDVTLIKDILALPTPSMVPANLVHNKLSLESQKRRRFRGHWLCPVAPDVSPDISLAAGFYLMILKIIGKSSLIWQYNLPALLLNKDLRSKFSDHAFVLHDDLSPDWRYLCHFARLGDYLPSVDQKEFDDTLRSWVSPKLHLWNGSAADYLKQFEEHAIPYYSEYRPIHSDLTYNEFVLNRTLWARAGSVTMPPEVKITIPKIIDHNGVETTVEKTKWVAAWTLSDDELLIIANSDRPTVAKGLQKREITKVRAIVSADLTSYLRMAYISYIFLDKYHKTDTFSPLFMNSTQQEEMWDKLRTLIGIRFPLDQGQFDQMQLRDAIIKLIDLITSAIRLSLSGCALTSALLVMSQLKNCLLAGVVLLSDGTSVPWLNGILSGWRWTAYLDTMINIVTIQMALTWSRQFIPITLIDLLAQGDDDALCLQTYEHAVIITLAYQSLGFIINPKKNFCSTIYNEFLRRVILPDAVTGYPARSVTALLWSDPSRTAEGDNPGSASSVTTRWRLLANRCQFPIERLPFITDICNSTGMSRSEVELWLSTPATFGGAGMSQTPLLAKHHLMYTPARRILKPGLIKLPGLTKISQKYPGRWAEFVTSTLKARPHRRLPRWHTYYGTEVPGLQRETNPKRADVVIGPNLFELASSVGKPWYKSPAELRSPTTRIGSGVTTRISKMNIRAHKLPSHQNKYFLTPNVEEAVGMTLASIVDTPSDLITNSDAILQSLGRYTKLVAENCLLGRMDMSSPYIPGVSPARASYAIRHLVNGAQYLYLLSTGVKTMERWADLNLLLEYTVSTAPQSGIWYSE